MITPPGNVSRNAASSSEMPAILSEDITSKALEDLRHRIAVRFLIKKSKRFYFGKQPLQNTEIPVKKEPMHECLLYLGLAPKNARTLDRKEPKHETETDSQFRKPKLYECSYCMKFFFHKTIYRRHMMHHMRKSLRCLWCNRGFTSKISKRRHEIFCRH